MVSRRLRQGVWGNEELTWLVGLRQLPQLTGEVIETLLSLFSPREGLLLEFRAVALQCVRFWLSTTPWRVLLTLNISSSVGVNHMTNAGPPMTMNAPLYNVQRPCLITGGKSWTYPPMALMYVPIDGILCDLVLLVPR
jgi:hypothetical protein